MDKLRHDTRDEPAASSTDQLAPVTALPVPEAPVLETTTGTTAATVAPVGYSYRKDDYRKRLRRIEGQARGLQRMVDEEKYCIDILTQVSAMTKALQAVSLGLLEEHLSHCVVDAAKAGDDEEAQRKLREASDAIGRLVRS